MIYVGATSDPRRRMTEHSASTWWLDVDQSQTSLFRYPHAQAASEAERALIANYVPRHNRAGITGAYIPYRPSGARVQRTERADEMLSHLARIARETAKRPALIEQARREGATWEQIAAALQMSRAGVIKLHAKHRPEE